MRKCKRCNQPGHNSQTCNSPMPKDAHETKTLIEKGREIISAGKQKVARIEIDGEKPHRGAWLIKEKEKKCAGLISYVKRNGTIVWRDFGGVFVDTSQSTVISSGYKYSNDMPVGEGWTYLHLGMWSKNSTMKQIEEETEIKFLEENK